MRLPWQRPAATHKHDKLGGWRGDVWDFDEPDAAGAQAVRHVARWLCSCGHIWVEDRAANEYPHMLANVKVRGA